MEGLWENPEQYADQIRDALEPFQTSLDEIDSQKREVEKAQMARADLLEKVGERLTWSICFFEAVYQLAGLGYHAERLQVSLSSRSSTGEPPAEGGESTEGGESGESPAAKSSETEASAS